MVPRLELRFTDVSIMLMVWLPPASRDPLAGEIEMVIPGPPPLVLAVHETDTGPVLVSCTVWICGGWQPKAMSVGDAVSQLSPGIGVVTKVGTGVTGTVVAVGCVIVGAGVTVG
jgi:hypothetical protein